MTFISNKLNKNCVYEKSNILDVLNVFESTGINLALVINKNKEFVGVISSSDIRRGLIRGLDKSSKIKKIINYSPLYLKDEIDENQLSNLISSPKFNEINPPYIPILDKRNKPRGVIDKQNLNLRFLKRKKNCKLNHVSYY